MLEHAERSSSPAAGKATPLLAELQGGVLSLTPAGAWTVENFATLHAAIEKVKSTARKGNLRQAALRLSVDTNAVLGTRISSSSSSTLR